MSKVSKNSKKGSSKPTQMIMPKRVKEKKQFLYFEVTDKNYQSVKEQQDLSYFVDGSQEFVIEKLERRFGKTYFKVKNN